MNDHLLPPSRRPIVISDSLLSAGRATTPVDADDPEALLRDYLRLIRRVRNQRRDRSIALRRADIGALAVHLEWSEERVLGQLADLMGSTRRQRATMLAVLATGAALITIATPTAVAADDAGSTSTSTNGEPPVVVMAGHLAAVRSPSSARPAARVIASDPSTSTSHSSEPRRAPVLEAQLRRTTDSEARALHDFTPTEQAPTSPEPPESAASGADAPDASASPGIPESAPTPAPASATTADGPDAVAVGEPPVPPATDADGNFVAVGEPPVPPDNDEVAVGEPPVPPATDADGNFVAVGEPPVPPPTP